MLDVGWFDRLSVDGIEELISTSNLEHILDNTVIGLFKLLDYISDIIFVHYISCSVQFEFLDEL